MGKPPTRSICLALAAALLVPALCVPTARSAIEPAVVERLKNATVFVSLGSSRRSPSGTGFVVHVQGRRALVVTNAHVARRGASDSITVVLNSGTRRARSLPARVLGRSEASDLALLELDADRLPLPLELPASGEVMETEEVLIVGFPFGTGFSTNRSTPVITISRGTVSSKRLDVNDEPRLLQIDGDLNPGNSGGPIVNATGELVGIAVSTVRQTNIGFAIPVARLRAVLAGAMVDLHARASVKGVEIRAERLDPLARIQAARLLVGAATESRIAEARSASGAWGAVLDAPFTASFQAEADDRPHVAVHALPRGLRDDQVLFGQIQIEDRDGLRHLPPFRITPRKLAVALEGAWVHQPEAGDGQAPGTAQQESTARPVLDKRALHDLFVKSGLDALILKLASPSQSTFGNTRAGDEDERTVRERLLEVLQTAWDEDRVRRHYLGTFEARADARAMRQVSALMDLPAMQSMHFTIERFDSVSDAALARYLSSREPAGAAARERLELMRRIDSLRRFSESLTDAVGQSSATVARLLNDLKPRGTRMSTAILDREIQRALSRFEAGIRKRVPALLRYLYRDASAEDLRDYISTLGSDTMRWFTEREYTAFKTLAAARFASAETELLALFKSLRREMFGLEEGPSVQGLDDTEAVKAIVESYGKETVIGYLLENNGGAITIQKGGSMVIAYGRPRLDLITERSIVRDLQRMKLTPQAFVDAMEEFQVNTKFQDRRLNAASRRARLMAALRARHGRQVSRRRNSMTSSAARYCATACSKSFNACRHEAQDTTRRCRSDARKSSDRRSAYVRCSERQQLHTDECAARRQQCQANC